MNPVKPNTYIASKIVIAYIHLLYTVLTFLRIMYERNV